MRMLAGILLVAFQAVLALVFVWQVIGLLPVLGWIGQGVGAGYWFVGGIKLAVALVTALLFWGAGRLRRLVSAQA